MAIEPLEALTCICIARGLSPDTWLRLVKEAKAAEVNDAAAGETDATLHKAALDVLLVLIRNQNAALAQAYLQACLPSLSEQLHLVQRLLDISNEAASNTSAENDTLGANNLFFEGIAAGLLASNTSVAQEFRFSASSALAIQQLQASVRILGIGARNQLSSLFLLALQLLQVELPGRSNTDAAVVQQLLAEVATAREALQSMTNAAVALPYPFELAHRLLDKLDRIFDAAAYRRRTMVPYLTFPSLPLEMEAILQFTLLDNSKDAESQLVGSLRARLFYQKGMYGGDIQQSDKQAVLVAWLGDLFACCLGRVAKQDKPTTRDEARWRSFTYGRLPDLLRACQKVMSHLDWDLAKQAALLDLGRLSNGMQTEELSDDAKTLQGALSDSSNGNFADRLGTDSDADSLISALYDIQEDYGMHAAAANFVASRVQAWTASSDLSALHQFFFSLARSIPRILDYILLHVAAEDLLQNPCSVLDTWDASEEYGASQSMEMYGGILLALQTITKRHGLRDTLASKIGYTVVSSVLQSLTSASSPQSLGSLSEEHRKLVSSWITALYGSEGIDDELIRSTPPRVMLHLAPTIVHQSMAAQEVGIIDLDTLSSGLSYFTQDFLAFTLPGIIAYLSARPQPNLQVIRSLLASESTPGCIWELSEHSLRKMLEFIDPASEDARFIRGRLGPGSTSVPILGASVTTAILTGSDVAQTVRAFSNTHQPVEAVKLLLQLDNPILASAVSEAGDGLFPSFVEQYLPRVLNTAAEDEASQIQIHKLADLTALWMARSGVQVKRNSKTPAWVAFWERVDSWPRLD